MDAEKLANVVIAVLIVHLSGNTIWTQRSWQVSSFSSALQCGPKYIYSFRILGNPPPPRLKFWGTFTLESRNKNDSALSAAW